MKLIIADTYHLPGIDYLMVAKSKEPVLLCMPSAPKHILSTYQHASYYQIDPQKWQSVEALGRKIDEEGWQFSQVFIALESTYCRFVVELFQSRSQVYEELYLVDSPWLSPTQKIILNSLERWQLIEAIDHEILKNTLLNLIPEVRPLRVIFLHGVGQTSQAWKQVVEQLPAYEYKSLELFEGGRLPTFTALQEEVRKRVRESDGPVVLVGLSLGAMVALSLLEEPESNLVGVVSIAGQYRFVANKAYKFQLGLIKLLPRFIFAKQGLDKGNLLDFYRELANLDMTEFLKTHQVPVLLVCGDKDRVNLKTSRELEKLMPKAEFHVLRGAGHEVNKDKPFVLAQIVAGFLGRL